MELRPFQGAEVSGDDVLACWQFQPGAEELLDSKGTAVLSLQGRCQVVADPVFGGALECQMQTPGEDKPHGARAAQATAPMIDGAFSIEAWVKLRDEKDWVSAYVVDKMYIPKTHEQERFNKDYFFSLRHNKNNRKITLLAGIGLGKEVILFNAPVIDYAPEQWRLLAFHYDGAGTGMFFVNGELIGQVSHADKGLMAPGRLGLCLGDRYGSRYAGLPGQLAQVRLVRGLPSQVKLVQVELQQQFQRYVFERMEAEQKLQLQIVSLTKQKITGLRLLIDDGLTRKEQALTEAVEPDKPLTIELPIPTDGKAGQYSYQVKVQGTLPGGQLVEGASSWSYQICRRLPEFMPVVMWGGASLEKMQATGFTHSLHWLDHLDSQSWKAGEPLGFQSRYDQTRKTFNEVMAAGLRVLGKISPGGYFKNQAAYAKDREDYLSLDHLGNPTKQVDFSLPRMQQFAFDSARTMANNISMYPVVDMVLANSEFRDSNQVSFRPETVAAFRAATGLPGIPPEVESKGGVKYARLPDFPHDRIIPEDFPLLAYYRWFWGGGDGYPGFMTETWRGLHNNEKATWKVLWDPVVRSPSKWGSGGAVDWVGHWTYVYPDPLVMGLATDEVLAMRKGGPDYQEPTKMTQVIWYRSATTGTLPEDKSKWAEWETRLPEARFITIPPDMLEIAFWQKISRPVKAIMYHGAGSLWDKGKPGGYDFTHPDTQPRLASLSHNVIRPFGPMLLQVPERQAKVAMLESFAAQMFYGGSTRGTMARPAGRMHGALTRAHLQPEIIYDETILRDGLDNFTVLVMPSCAVLSAGVAKRIIDWQAAGGIVAADSTLAPGIMPDVLLPQLLSNDKQESIACGKMLRQELGDLCLPFAEADTADAILRMRSYRGSDYLFAFNDRRVYGDYVGQYKKVMEQGEPMRARITLHRPAPAVVYDLLAKRKIEPVSAADGASMSFAADFGPGEGRLYLIMEKQLASVKLEFDPQARRGQRTAFNITVYDDSGQPADAVIPLQISGVDAAGEPLEIVGWYAAPGGKLTVNLDVARNDTPGDWQIRVQELASGKEAQASFQVQ